MIETNNYAVLLQQEYSGDDSGGISLAEISGDQTVTKKEFEAFTTKMKTDVATLQTGVKAAQDAVMPNGLPLGTISLVTMVLLIVVALGLLISKLTSKESPALTNLEGNLKKDFEERLKSRDNEIKRLSAELSNVTNALNDLKAAQDNQQKSLERKLDELLRRPTDKVQLQKPTPAHPIRTSAPPPQPVTRPELYQNFVSEFNALMKYKNDGHTYDEVKKYVDGFISRHKLKAFSCTNFEARMGDPIPPPVFESAANGDFWAYECEPGVYAVVPSTTVKSYTNNHHVSRAMGEVFNSNFTAGNTYTKISVKKPAIFKGTWNLLQKGELELS